MFGLFETGFGELTWGSIVMIVIGCVLLYLGIARKMEPLLLVPIGFGVILVNLPLGGLMETIVGGQVVDSYAIDGEPVGIISRIFRYGLSWEIIPVFIFLGLGAMTDFGPLIANPKTLILGAGAQFGVYFAFFIALVIGNAFPDLVNIGIEEACSIGIIGGADGPTTVYLTNKLAPHFIGATAVAAYTYMALVPIIQPPIIRLLTTKAERKIYMKPQLRPVSRKEKLFFPLIASIVIILLVPKSAPLVGMFMLGNLLFVSGVTDRLADTAANAFMNILTVLLGVCVGCFMSAEAFLRVESLIVFGLGVVAFSASTAFGVLLAKFMNLFSKEKINPMIGAAGVSAVPMAARVVQKMGQQENPRNFLLMHAMGPNIAGVIGTATAAGIFLGMVG
ncbi:MAG: sodium ion-translocating decarboxylase subunit beta [Dehalococcoidales bacterium]|nr:MAG: sodium ion-translocating decarboxylase subunit beta [Dehalococcoidales bacterium]